VQSGEEVAIVGVSGVGEEVSGIFVACEMGDRVGGRVEVTKGSVVGVISRSEILIQAVSTIPIRNINTNFRFMR